MGFELEFDPIGIPEAPEHEVICEYQTPDGKYCSLESIGDVQVVCPIRSLEDALSTLRCPEYEPTTSKQKT